MDKFFIRGIATVWAFNQRNEAVWKCSNIDKLKITQDGNTIRKKDSQGATIFKMDCAKSASISFEVNYWDFNILSMISSSEKTELDGTDNPYMVKPIAIPHTEIHTLKSEDISSGYIELENTPRINEYYYHEIALHKIDNKESIVMPYQQNSVASKTCFSVDSKKLYLPTSLNEGDTIETVYEYNSNYGTKLVSTSDYMPETWRVKILMLVSPICNTDQISAVWITANNATPATQMSLDFNVEDNIPISLELGHSICDREKKLYEIVSAGMVTGEEDLRTNDNQVLYTYDNEPVRTLQ